MAEIQTVANIHPRAERENSTESRSFLASVGAVGAGFAASLCCIGPLIFVTFGVGAGLASTFDPFRWLFTALMVVALAFGFYSVYGRKLRSAGAGPGASCELPRSRTREKALLWSATALALVFWTFEYWSGVLA
jgi:mercuric ion transport protein